MLNEWTNSANPNIKPVKMSRNYFCVDCKISTRNPRIYLEHRRDFHRDSMTIHKCTLCMYASKHSQKLTRHMRTIHREVIQSPFVRPIAAGNALGQATANATEMVPPLQCDKSARTTTCKLCGLYTGNKSILMQHIHTDHPEVRIYKCDQCEYSHYIRDRYNRHHRYHSMNYVQCKLCEFKTIYRWNLERHMRHHVDSISMGFRCKKCNFTASTKQSITAHEIAHHSGLNGVVQQQENNNESNVLQIQLASTMNAATVNNPMQQNNNVIDDCIMNDAATAADEDDDDGDGASDFDASEFLQIVFDNAPTQKPKTSNRSTAMQSPMMKQESAMELFQQQIASKNKFFYCVNCHFRNEVDWSQSTSDRLSTVCPNFNQLEQPTVTARYRCGHCHQASNWKHVIERHCRLVHNTSGLIEKFSAENQSFHRYIPTKRRFETGMETATAAKSMAKIEWDESAATQTESSRNKDNADKRSFFPDALN